MTKYRVYLEAVASVSVEVEADDQDHAIELAFDKAPRAAWDWPDMGDWYFPADETPPPGVPPRRAEDYIEVIQ